MNNFRLGLFQESSDRFALALHADVAHRRLYREFTAGDLRAEVVVRPDGTTGVELVAVPAEVAQARDLVFEAMSRDPGSVVAGGVMALDTFSDSWILTVLRDFAPGYHVSLAFSFYPLRVSFREGSLIHVGYETAVERDAQATWHMLHPAVAAQAAAIVFPNAPTGADGCALLARHPGVVDYLLGTGDVFSLADIEQLARGHQVVPSIVVAAARGVENEDRTWLYRVKLGERAVAGAGLLAVSYARARRRHLAGLRSRPPRDGLREDQLQFREAQIERYSHHLALLEVCVEYRIGLWSCPMSRGSGEWLESDTEEPSDQWSVAVDPE